MNKTIRQFSLIFMILILLIGCHRDTQPEPKVDSQPSDEFVSDSWTKRLGVQSEAEIQSLKQSRHEIDLAGTDITDAELSSLQYFDRIKILDISSTYLTDDCVDHVLKLRSLSELDVVFTRITGAGIRKLGAHPNLTTVAVWYDQLDENGLAGLQDMENLRKVNLWVRDFGDEDEVLPPKIKRLRPDVDVKVMWYVHPMDSK